MCIFTMDKMIRGGGGINYKMHKLVKLSQVIQKQPYTLITFVEIN